jgi:5,10-methylenetetrahydromethanopterin reductase
MIYAACVVPGLEFPRFQGVVASAERLGYGGLWIADEGLYPYVSLAVAALASSRLTLGIGVTNPYTRPPALTAAAIASIDELSGGRAVLGLGAGGSAVVALGIERLHPTDAVRDAIAIINGLTQHGRVDHQGRRLSYRGSLNFTPARRVPIFVAARGPQMLRLAGEAADGAIVSGIATPGGIGAAARCVADGARRAERDPATVQIVSWLYTSIADDRTAARDAVRTIVATSVINSRHSLAELGVSLPASLRGVLDRHEWKRTPESVAAVRTELTDEIIDAFSLTGPVEACAVRLRGLGALGVNQVAALFFPPAGGSVEEQMRLFAEHVVAGG